MKTLSTWSIFQIIFVTISIICIKRTVNTIDCTNEFNWPCHTGNQCIDIVDRCDGVPNCADGSDETIKNCIQKTSSCNSYNFRCTYGACIVYSLRCDGKNDCADGSDELPAECKKDEWERALKGDCPSLEIKCRSGECISQDNMCDGKADCADASDESLEVCSAYYCPNISFRCGYGGCVNGDATCNGKADCYDASDESPVLCQTNLTNLKPPTPTPTPVTSTSLTPTPTTTLVTLNVCRIPYNKYNLIVQDFFTGAVVPLGDSVSVNQPVFFSCESGFRLKGANNSVCKGGNAWTKNLPDCYHYCSDEHPRSGFSTKVTFEFKGAIIKKNLFEPNTIARISCAYYYEEPKIFWKTLTCTNNGWNRPKVSCNMRCGQPEAPVTQFSKGGVKTNITEVPWHVGIYQRSETDHYENICAGTIISPRVVVSAAHCFFQAQRTQFSNNDWSSYSIAAGKYYRDYDKEEFDSSAVGIKEVWTPFGYKGAENGFYRDISIIKLDKFFVFSDTIRPACLYVPEEANRNIRSGIKGRVSAWGQTNARDRESTLQTLHMETVSHGKCNETLSEKFINVRGDKFCLAPYSENTFACKGDSGSGFVVGMADGSFALYGVVSYSPTRTQDCSNDQLLVMTNALFYISQLQEYVNEDLDNDVYFGSPE